MTVDNSNKVHVSVGGSTSACSLYTTPAETKGNYQEIILKDSSLRYLTLLETNDSLMGNVAFKNVKITNEFLDEGTDFSENFHTIYSFSINRLIDMKIVIDATLTASKIEEGNFGFKLVLDDEIIYEKKDINDVYIEEKQEITKTVSSGAHVLKLYTFKPIGQVYDNIKGSIFISTINSRAVDLPNVIDASIYRDNKEFFMMTSANQPLQTINKRGWTITLTKGQSYGAVKIYEAEFTIVQTGTYRISSRIYLYSEIPNNGSWLRFYTEIDNTQMSDTGEIKNRNTTSWIYLFSKDVYLTAGVHKVKLYAHAYCVDGILKANINPWETIIGSNEYQPVSGNFDLRRTYKSIWTYDWFSPPGVTRVNVQFSWHYDGDEIIRLAAGKHYWADRWSQEYRFGCSIGDNQTNVCWVYYNDRDTRVAVSPQTYYQICVFVDGYKDRDYGFIVSWSPSINSGGYQIDARK